MPNIPDGCGRCRREFYYIMVGDKTADVDELRAFRLAGPKLAKMAQALDPPPTPAEYKWMLDWAVRLSDTGRDDFMRLAPAPVVPKPPAWYTQVVGAIRSWFSAQFA